MANFAFAAKVVCKRRFENARNFGQFSTPPKSNSSAPESCDFDVHRAEQTPNGCIASPANFAFAAEVICKRRFENARIFDQISTPPKFNSSAPERCDFDVHRAEQTPHECTAPRANFAFATKGICKRRFENVRLFGKFSTSQKSNSNASETCDFDVHRAEQTPGECIASSANFAFAAEAICKR